MLHISSIHLLLVIALPVSNGNDYSLKKKHAVTRKRRSLEPINIDLEKWGQCIEATKALDNSSAALMEATEKLNSMMEMEQSEDTLTIEFAVSDAAIDEYSTVCLDEGGRVHTIKNEKLVCVETVGGLPSSFAVKFSFIIHSLAECFDPSCPDDKNADELIVLAMQNQIGDQFADEYDDDPKVELNCERYELEMSGDSDKNSTSVWAICIFVFVLAITIGVIAMAIALRSKNRPKDDFVVTRGPTHTMPMDAVEMT